MAAPALHERDHRFLQGHQRLHTAWVLLAARIGVLDDNGQPVPQPNGPGAYGIPLGHLPPSCAPLNGGATTIAPSCAQALTRFRGFITYQPADRYWAFQGIETGIFIILAAILLSAAAVVLLRRDA